MIRRDEISPIGKVIKTHGIDGELSVSFDFFAFDEVVSPGACLIFDIEGIYVPFYVASVRTRGTGSLLIRLDGEDTQKRAAMFTGREVFMQKEILDRFEEDSDGQLYASDLVGFKAIAEGGDVIGEIEDYDDSTDNPLFHVRGPEDKLLLIPIVEEFITDIDSDKKIITFDLPTGLLEI